MSQPLSFLYDESQQRWVESFTFDDSHSDSGTVVMILAALLFEISIFEGPSW